MFWKIINTRILKIKQQHVTIFATNQFRKIITYNIKIFKHNNKH